MRLLLLLPLLAACADPAPLEGVWIPETYHLADGTELPVTGRIFFAGTDWTVLYFVLDEDGTPKQGSGEGGTFTFDGTHLTFRHRYYLAGGEAVGSLPPRPLALEVHDAAGAAGEACTVSFGPGRMEIAFPSGNTMTFRRPGR